MTTRQEAVRARYCMGGRPNELFVARIAADPGHYAVGDAVRCLAAQVFVMRHGRHVSDPLGSQFEIERWLATGVITTYVANHDRSLRLTGCMGYMIVDRTDRFMVQESAIRHPSSGSYQQTIIFGSMVRTMLEDNIPQGSDADNLNGRHLSFAELPVGLQPSVTRAMSLQRVENGLIGDAGEVYSAIGRIGIVPVPI